MQGIDITNWKRGQEHPTDPSRVLGSWRYNPDGTRYPSWQSKVAFYNAKDRIVNGKYVKIKKTNIKVILSPLPKKEEKLEPVIIKIVEEPIENKIVRGDRNLTRMLQDKKRESRKKRIPFGLTIEKLPPVPDKCPVFGIPLVAGVAISDDSPSLDRIIPSEGYVPGNVIWVSNFVNRIKTDASWRQILAVAEFYKNLEDNPKAIPKPVQGLIVKQQSKPITSTDKYPLGVINKIIQDDYVLETKLISNFENKKFWDERNHYFSISRIEGSPHADSSF